MTNLASASTVSEIFTTLKAAHPPSTAVDFDFDGYHVQLQTNREELVQLLRSYFREFLADERGETPETVILALDAVPPALDEGRHMTLGEYKPSVKGPKEAFCDLADGRLVHKLRTGMWFAFGGSNNELNIAVGPALENDNQVINFINNRMIQRSLHRGGVLGHCASVSLGRRAITVAGFSGMGKSTLSLHLMADERLRFISNDRVMVHRRSEHDRGRPGTGPVLVEGIPKHPRINPGTALNDPNLVGIMSAEERTRFGALSTDALWDLEHKYDALIHDCYGPDRFDLWGELVGAVMLNWKRGGGPMVAQRVDLAQRRDLLPAFMKPTGVFYVHAPGAIENPTEADYLRALEGVAVLELSGGVDFEAAKAPVMELLAAGGTR